MRYTFRRGNGGKYKPQTVEAFKNYLLCAELACFCLTFALIIAILAIVAVNCIQDMPVVSILLGALDIIMIFLLLSMISRAFAVGKRKK